MRFLETQTQNSLRMHIPQTTEEDIAFQVPLGFVPALDLQRLQASEYLVQTDNEPFFICQGADPHVTRNTINGRYVLTYMNPNEPEKLSSMMFREANDIYTLRNVEPRHIKFAALSPEFQEFEEEVWAPELHFIDGKPFIFISMGKGEKHRPYCFTANSLDEEFYCLNKTIDQTDRWGIDATTTESNHFEKEEWIRCLEEMIPDQWKENPNPDDYFMSMWSGWKEEGPFPQIIYGGVMDKYGRIISERVELVHPEECEGSEFEWGDGKQKLLEGPEFLVENGRVLGMFGSKNASWRREYTGFFVQYEPGSDGHPLKKECWRLYPDQILPQNRGHFTPIQDVDGSWKCISHTKTEPDVHSWRDRWIIVENINEWFLRGKLLNQREYIQ